MTFRTFFLGETISVPERGERGRMHMAKRDITPPERHK